MQSFETIVKRIYQLNLKDEDIENVMGIIVNQETKDIISRLKAIDVKKRADVVNTNLIKNLQSEVSSLKTRLYAYELKESIQNHPREANPWRGTPDHTHDYLSDTVTLGDTAINSLEHHIDRIHGKPVRLSKKDKTSWENMESHISDCKQYYLDSINDDDDSVGKTTDIINKYGDNLSTFIKEQKLNRATDPISVTINEFRGKDGVKADNNSELNQDIQPENNQDIQQGNAIDLKNVIQSDMLPKFVCPTLLETDTSETIKHQYELAFHGYINKFIELFKFYGDNIEEFSNFLQEKLAAYIKPAYEASMTHIASYIVLRDDITNKGILTFKLILTFKPINHITPTPLEIVFHINILDKDEK